MTMLVMSERGEVRTMVYKSSVWGTGKYRSYQGDQEQFGQELLVQLFLATNEADELIADGSALQLAQQQLDRQPFAVSTPRRRVLPPRRHLRDK